MPKWLILLSAFSATAALAAPAWRWVDANGQVHYSDRPVPGATQVELAGAQTFGNGSRRQTQASPSSQPGAAPGNQASSSATAYRLFNIVSPGQQQTLWGTGSVLNVQVELQPALQPNHRIDVMIDGERRNLNATSTQLAVPDVYRGQHTLQAVIIDQAGTEVLRSLATTFMIQQTSVQSPTQNGGASQPPQAQPKAGNGASQMPRTPQPQPRRAGN
jgi:hypothetical protein